MNTKYRKSAAPQKNPVVCLDKLIPDLFLDNGDPHDLIAAVTLHSDAVSGLQIRIAETLELTYCAAANCYNSPIPDGGEGLRCRWEFHADDIHGRLTTFVYFGGSIILTSQSPWIPLKSRRPCDSGYARYTAPTPDTHVEFLVTG